jgi:hypothetical protein
MQWFIHLPNAVTLNDKIVDHISGLAASPYEANWQKQRSWNFQEGNLF